MTGQRGRAEAVLHELRRLSESSYVGHIPLFALYLGLGEVDVAVSELELAFG
jgi:hypothetical protein